MELLSTFGYQTDGFDNKEILVPFIFLENVSMVFKIILKDALEEVCIRYKELSNPLICASLTGDRVSFYLLLHNEAGIMKRSRLVDYLAPIDIDIFPEPLQKILKNKHELIIKKLLNNFTRW